jgi:glycosyltransferase involved in cell wall biosynthesis
MNQPAIASMPAGNAPVVLHVRVMAGTGGGPEKTILRSPGYVDATRYRVAAAYIHPVGDKGIEKLAAEAKTHGCPLIGIPERGPVDLRTLKRLLQLCRRMNVAIWHGHDYKSNLIGLLLRRYHPMKLITTAHGWLSDTLRLKAYRAVDRMCLKRYDHVACVSSNLYEHCINDLHIPADRVSLVHNAIELRPWARLRMPGAARQALGLEPANTVLGCVGRLSYEKGLDRALQAVGSLSLRVPNLQFVIIGDGPELGALSDQVHQMRLDRVVRFVGWCKPLQPWYEAMDALLLPSRTEGLPNVLLEAMAMGVPVASTNVGGVADLLDRGRCGILLDDDVDQWCEPLSALMGDARLRGDYSAAARHHIETHFTFEHRMAKIIALYDQLMGVAADAKLRQAA